MAWTVHGLYSKSMLFNIDHKDVILVVNVVTRSFPKVNVENIWTQNLIVSSDSVLLSNHVHQIVINHGTFWVEECTTR